MQKIRILITAITLGLVLELASARTDPLRSEEICRRPSIRKGRVVPDLSRYYRYEMVVILCSYPYVRIGPNTATCLLNGTFTELPRCVACNMKAPTNGYVRPRLARVYENVKFGCHPGYSLDGDDSQYCKNDGTLSGDAPTCKRDPFCRKPTLGENLNVIPDEEEYEVGDEILYQCSPHQNITPSDAISSVCGNDGKFTGQTPTCVNATNPIVCTRPATLSKRVSLRPHQESFSVGTRVRFSCTDDYDRFTGDQSSICRGDGAFKFKNLPTCQG